jgi:hypothetical protein
MRSRALAVTAVVLGLFTTPRAAAAGLEEIDLQLRADPKCVERAVFTKLVASYGGSFADVPVARRTFDVSVDQGERIVGRLVIRDAEGVVDIRVVAAQTCDEVSRLLALLVAMALEGEPKPAPQAQTAERPWYYLLPKGEEEPDALPPTTKKPGRQGSGGLAVDAFYGARLGMHDQAQQRGVHVYGAELAGRSIRLGIAGAFALEENQMWSGRFERRTEGPSLRLGGMLGWGAPWNDTVAGFRVELGAMAGMHRGTTVAKACTPDGQSCGPFPAGPREQATGWAHYVTPYVSWSLVLQIPLRMPVRPIAGVTGMLAGGPPGEVRFFSSVDVGLVWQAW